MKSKTLLVFFASACLLTLGFYRNQWNAAGRKWFFDWGKNSDLMLVARLVWSRQNGVLSEGALFGVGDGQWPLAEGMSDHQYDVYMNNGTFKTYSTYNSVIGAQGIAFGLLDRFTDFTPSLNLKLLRGITSVLSAAVLAVIVSWFFIEFGYLPAIFVLGFCLVSEWLTLYGGSIYWQLWAFYIPIVAVGYYLLKIGMESNLRHTSLAVIALAAVVIKGWFNGFEFITPTLAMMAVPLVYYAVLQRWKVGTFVAASLNILLSALAGIFFCLVLLSIQIASVTGDLAQAIDYLAFTFGKRSLGDPSQYSGFVAEGLRANVWSVLWKYIYEDRAINLSNFMHTNIPWLQGQLEIEYYRIFVLFILFSLFFIAFSKRNRLSPVYNKAFALFYATWFSIIPPLSWLVLFKAHAYVHGQLDYIIWQMPFTLFGFAFCGMVVKYVLSSRHIKQDIPST